MKLALTLVLVLGTTMAQAQTQEMKNFNKVLIQEVQHSLATDNDQNLKKSNAPMRGPASVEVEVDNYQENVKIKKNERQLGNPKW
jgi:hypothetical protein